MNTLLDLSFLDDPPLSRASRQSEAPGARRDRTEANSLGGPAGPWNSIAAQKLMFDADTLVESLEVSGRHPEIATAAERVARANLTGDLAQLRQAVAAFEAVVRKVAGKPVSI